MLNDLHIQFPEDFEERYEKYVAGIRGEKIKAPNTNPQEPARTYPDIKEDIAVKTLGLEIKDGYVHKGKARFKINPTDAEIIDFLYQRYARDKDTCTSIDVLQKTLQKSKGNIKNRIVYINDEIRKMVSGDRKTNIDEFIKNESGRGFRLNPRFVIEIINSK